MAAAEIGWGRPTENSGWDALDADAIATAIIMRALVSPLLSFLQPIRSLLAQPLRLLSTSASSGIGSPLPRAPEHGACIYLDYQATTPVWPEVAAAAEPYLKLHWGNPSSGHAFGRPCASAVAKARREVASLINAAEDEIMFTGCGSEADNHAIFGALELEEARRRDAGASAAKSPLPHVVASNIEHPAIEKCLDALKAAGRLDVSYVPVDNEGRVSAEAIGDACTKHTILVSVMHSNNEVGSLQPVAEIVEAARRANPAILVHTDAAQSIGKVEVDVEKLGVSMMTIVGHKFGAPKGVAALYIKKGLSLPNYMHGGGQEGGRRAGTECVVLLAAIGEAARIAKAEATPLRAHMKATRDALAQKLIDGLPDGSVRINGPADASHRLPNTLSIGLKGVKSSILLNQLSEELAASAGAACHTNHASISAVLRAMDVPAEYAVGTLRLSTGRHSSMEEIDKAARLIIKEAKRQWAEEGKI